MQVNSKKAAGPAKASSKPNSNVEKISTAETGRSIDTESQYDTFSKTEFSSGVDEQNWARPVNVIPPRPVPVNQANLAFQETKMSKEEADAAFERKYPPHVQESILAELRWKYGIEATKLERRTE